LFINCLYGWSICYPNLWPHLSLTSKHYWSHALNPWLVKRPSLSSTLISWPLQTCAIKRLRDQNAWKDHQVSKYFFFALQFNISLGAAALIRYNQIAVHSVWCVTLKCIYCHVVHVPSGENVNGITIYGELIIRMLSARFLFFLFFILFFFILLLTTWGKETCLSLRNYKSQWYKLSRTILKENSAKRFCCRFAWFKKPYCCLVATILVAIFTFSRNQTW